MPPEGAAVTEQSETLENAVATQLTLPRRSNSGEWYVSLAQEDANAWLATRLKRWCDSRGIDWPRGVSGVQVRFERGYCTFGAVVEFAGAERFVAVDVEPRIGPEGALYVKALGGRVGLMSVPLGSALAALGEMGGGLRAKLSGEEALMREPRIKLEDGRVVRMLGVEAYGGRVEVRCRTEVGR